MEVQIPTRKGQLILREKGGRPRTCQDMSDGRYIQGDTAGGSNGTVRMPIGIYYMGHIGATWRILLNHLRAEAMRPYVKLLVGLAQGTTC